MTDTRSKILIAASDMFLSGGISALSVRAIAKQAGLSTIGIYSHFQGKQGILDALYIQGFELVYAAMDVPTEGREKRDVMIDCTQGYLKVAEENEAHYRLIFGESDPTYSPSEEARQASYKAFGKLLEMAAMYLPKKTKPEKVKNLALDIWAIVHGYSSLKHHAVFDAEAFDANKLLDWKGLAVKAVCIHLDAIRSQN